MKLFTIFTLSILFPFISLSAQSLRGTVFGLESGSQKPLAGATVRWLGTTKGAITKSDGSFTLERTQTDTLVTSYVGYKTDTSVVPPSNSSVDIILISGLRLAEVNVEAESTSTITQASAKTEQITVRQLEQSACCSLSEAFEKSPAVEVSFADASTGAKQIQLLGLRGIYTQIMTEAVPMIRGLATSYGLDYIPGAFVNEISISKGAASVLHGYEGITGQINVCYKQPENEIPLFVNGYANSMERMELNLTSAQHLSDTWHTMVFAHGRLQDHQQDGNGDGFIDMPTFRQVNGMARVLHRSEEGTEFQLITKGLHDEYQGGSMTHTMSANDTSHHEYGISTKTNRFEAISKFGLNPLTFNPETNLGLQVSGVWHSTSSMFDDRLYDGTEYQFQSKLILSNEFSGIKINYGASLLIDDFTEKFVDVTTLRTFIRREIVPGLFTEATISAIRKLTLVLGLRTDFHNMFGTFITPRLHGKYALTSLTTLRFSIGNGTRIANPVSDNLSAFASSRTVIFGTNLQPEKAWNYGGSVTTNFELFGDMFTFDAEIYRTDFSNQVVVDFDRSPRIVSIDNLAGTSYSTSGLVQLKFAPLSSIDVSISYRLVDARTTTGGKLRERPLISPHRILTTISWFTPDHDWQVDGTFIWNSGGRIPSTADNPEAYRMDERFTPFFRANAQITKRFEIFDLYLGAENITNFLQQQAVISPEDPHNGYFDASLVWGPLDNRLVYIGARLRIN
jgi:outer membrane receptor for ferrienterochelin and colicins